jgi:prophage maintenance system killer protein
MMKEKKIFQPLTSNDVCQIYELLLEDSLISFPLSKESRQKVDSLVSSINSFYFGKENYESLEEKALAYMYFIIKDHPFIDGNKRTSALVFTTICKLNGLKLSPEAPSLDALAIFIEKIKEADHHGAIKVLAQIIFE